MERAMHTVDARAVANYLLDRADADGKKIDPLLLQKLVYIAHGWHLGLLGRPLLSQQVEAWPYGPVIEDVYHAFKHFGPHPISGRAKCQSRSGATVEYRADLTPDTKDVVDQVWEKYKNFTGSQLITLTHQPGTPWAEVVKGIPPAERRGIIIPNEIIRRHYRALAMRNQAGKGSH